MPRAAGGQSAGPRQYADRAAYELQPQRRFKRARVLREGALSMILYGFDEKLLWAKRVGTFIRAMRGALGDRSLRTMWVAFRGR